VITSRQSIPAPNNPKGTLVLRFGGASSEIVVGGADVPVLDSTSAAEPPVEQAASPEVSASPERAVSVPNPEAEGDAVPGLGIDIGSARTEFQEARPARPPVGPDAAVLAAETAVSPERPLRTATGVRGAPAPVVPDLATTGALFSLLAFGGLGLVFATRLHRLRVMKVRA
jgi:hypothetical protein